MRHLEHRRGGDHVHVGGDLVERGKKYDRNAILFDTNADGTNSIREIRPAGSSQAIVFFE